MDLISNGAAWLAGQLIASASVNVAYKRGANTAQINATIGKSVFESNGQNGVTEQWESRDFIVKTDDLPYGQPVRGDMIVEELNGVAAFYEVAAPRGVPLFHYGDAFQQLVRVHTKKTDRDVTYIVTEQGDEIVVPLTAQG
jgi:hypothetical protein